MTLNLLTEDIKLNMANPKVFKFKTNAQRFKINFKVTDIIRGNYPHVGIPAHEGIMVLYRKSVNSPQKDLKERTWYNVEAYTERYDTTVFMHHLVKPGEEYEVMIYGPILSKISQLEIEHPEGTFAEEIKESPKSKILVAGGTMSFGIGCTTSAMLFSSILSRKFNASVDHLTFNNSNYLTDINNYYKENNEKNEYDIGILELDYSNQKDELVDTYLKNVITMMKSHCKKLICWYSLPPYRSYKKNKINTILNEIPSENIIFQDISYLFDKENVDICSYSGNFINDSGNMLIYKKLEEIIRSL
ncbi:MAG: hypothetical protein E7Z85_02640 [Methanosphaera stadtmanae]|nr:hypothetical protein [Methanosphaera stadtmanae]